MGVRAVSNFVGKRSTHRMPGPTKSLAAQVSDLITSFSGPKVWYDPSDISTLQQDAAGTIPVTTAGDPIGRIMDKSGAANHATQATAASRPLWQTTFSAFDGSDDSWTTSTIDFTSTDKITVVAGIRKLSDAAVGLVAELGTNANTVPGSFFLAAPPAASATWGFAARGATATAAANQTGAAAPITGVLTGILDIGAPSTSLRVNGVLAINNTAVTGGGTYGNYPLFVGRRNNTTFPFNGNLYGLIIIGRLLTPSEVVLCEQYMAQKTGISF